MRDDDDRVVGRQLEQQLLDPGRGDRVERGARLVEMGDALQVFEAPARSETAEYISGSFG